MEKHINTSGYDLYEISQSEWIFHVKEGTIFSGTFREVVIHAVTKFGFHLEEIETAIKDMIGKDHNAAHFGMHGMFIYSFNREFKYGQAS